MADDDGVLEFKCPGGTLSVKELAAGRRRLTAEPTDDSTFIGARTWETSYPVDLIELILSVKGLRSVCDEIKRDEDPKYLQHLLWWTLRGHVDVEEVGDGRILDFGCGSGASTMILTRMFPAAEIVGLDIDAEAHEIAQARRRYHGAEQVDFRHSLDGTGLPEGLGEYDFIVFSALYEHLLPAERKTVIPALWSHLRPGGLLFVGETPHRFAPVEIHTTGGLPLVNYMPPWLALRMARRMSSRIEPEATWPQLLRRGVRGGTERRFMRYFTGAGFRDAVIERPTKQGLRDEFDLWYQISHVNELPGFKTHLKTIFRALRRVSGVSFTPYLAFAVRKRQLD
jgi:SAM-dependent methyltransferase